MATLSRKKYKGIEFPNRFTMRSDEFNKKFGGCHIFKKLTDEDKRRELTIAYNIAFEDQSGGGPKHEATEALLEAETKVPIKK